MFLQYVTRHLHNLSSLTSGKAGRQMYRQPPPDAVEGEENPVLIEDIQHWDMDHVQAKEQINKVFQSGTQAAQELSSAARALKEDKLIQYLRVLKPTTSTTCGACYIFRQDAEHGPYNCPHLRPYTNVFKTIQKKIEYPDGWSGPCYTCHIVSYGSDLLHDPLEIGKKKCKRRDIVLPMLSALWVYEDRRAKLMQAMGAQWSTLQDYITWLSTPHPDHHTASMAVLAWVSNGME